MKYIKDLVSLGPLIFISFLLVFTRPFVGIYIFGYRLGELIIALGFFASISILPIYSLNYFKKRETIFSETHLLFIGVLVTFFISLAVYGSNVLAPYTFKVSSYVWTIGYLFIILYLFKDLTVIQRYKAPVLIVFLFIPVAHYIMSTGFYPNFVIDFFKSNSDKFEFTKASDIMLSYVIANMINIKFTKNKNFVIFYMYFTGALLLPLLVYMSRGSFVSTFLFMLIFSLYNFDYLKENIKRTAALIISTFLVFVISTFNVNDVEINYSFSFGEAPVAEGGTLSITENISELARKDQQRNAFLSLYFEDGRIYSVDQTTNWRLDIWQDVFEDMAKKNLLIKGYGYDEIIPVMTDPSAPGRLGRDGLNEHVHNYFVNIFARGGLFQFLLFISFHLSILYLWHKKYKDLSLILFMIPIFFNSTLDMSMEGVQYPVVYYIFLGFLINNGLSIKLNNNY